MINTVRNVFAVKNQMLYKTRGRNQIKCTEKPFEIAMVPDYQLKIARQFCLFELELLLFQTYSLTTGSVGQNFDLNLVLPKSHKADHLHVLVSSLCQGTASVECSCAGQQQL